MTGDGTVPDTGAAISHNLKATRETEWILGYEQKFGDWTAGLTYTHRNLDISAEDMAIDAAVLKYCADNGIAGCSNTWTGFNQYVITNPGHDVVTNLRGLDGREVTFKAEDLGYPKAKRTYDAVEFTVKHPWNGKWTFEGNYTWSRSKGNSEGFVQSDFQQDDSGITQDFDQPGFLEGMGSANVEEFGLAVEGEDALRPFLEHDREGIITADADSVITTLSSLLPDVDRAALTGEVGADLLANLAGGVEELYGWLDDDLAFTKAWGFELDDIRVPTYLWQGSADLMVPFHHGQWLAANIPGVVPHLLDGEGHLSIQVNRFEEMLDELLPHLA